MSSLFIIIQNAQPTNDSDRINRTEYIQPSRYQRGRIDEFLTLSFPALTASANCFCAPLATSARRLVSFICSLDILVSFSSSLSSAACWAVLASPIPLSAPACTRMAADRATLNISDHLRTLICLLKQCHHISAASATSPAIAPSLVILGYVEPSSSMCCQNADSDHAASRNQRTMPTKAIWPR